MTNTVAADDMVCRVCGHIHAADDWEATPEPKYCHACGATAVTPASDVTYTWPTEESAPKDDRRAPDQDAAIEQAFVAGVLPEKDRRDDDDDDDDDEVQIPDDIKVPRRRKR